MDQMVMGSEDNDKAEAAMVVVVHAVDDIEPGEPANMIVLLAFEWTQAAPQSFRVNDAASQNM